MEWSRLYSEDKPAMSQKPGSCCSDSLQGSAAVRDQSSSLRALREGGCFPAPACTAASEQSRSFSFKQRYLLEEGTRSHVEFGLFTTGKPIFLPCLLPLSFLPRFTFLKVYGAPAVDRSRLESSVCPGLLKPQITWSDGKKSP